jgi:hypothetical protein
LKTRPATERTVIFTASAALRRILAEYLQQALPERNTLALEGDRRRRDHIGKTFAETPGALLVAADTGSEGMNWQCASLMIHADIPWNPCIWEQRIGRIYRLGQHASEVEIVHVAVEGSADEAVLSLYEQALCLFDLAIGEAEAVLDHVPDPAMRDMQGVLKKRLGAATTRPREANWAYSAIFDYSEVLRAARRTYDSACAENDILDALLGLEDSI